MEEHVAENFAAEITEDVASTEIDNAVSARHSIARKYVLWSRRHNPEASPAELIHALENQYLTSITVAGAAITVGAIALDVGIAMIPVAGAAAAGVKSAGVQAAKQTGKEATKRAAKSIALGVAKGSAQKAASYLPAGDQQLQFEITAIFGLAIADIHGMKLDQDQSHALVYGLTNERVSQQIIAKMASDVASNVEDENVTIGRSISAGRSNWGHWASTLAESLPAGQAQSFIRTIQTGQLEDVRSHLSGTEQAVIEYGVGAVTGGITRFVFGRDVVRASREAFPEPPEEFPHHLEVPAKDPDDDKDFASNKAVIAMQEAAKSTGAWIVDAANVVGAGAVSAAGTVSRPFRSVDLDGDGIADEAQAKTVAKAVGKSVAGVSKNLAGSVSGVFSGKKKKEN